MERIPESHELMLDLDQAQAYAESDFDEPHNKFIAHFKELFPDFSEGLVLDIGCGSADPTIRFARAHPKTRLVGIDGSEAMLSFGRKAVDKAGLNAQIELTQGFLPLNPFKPRAFDAVICNSFLHQLDKPQVLWGSIKEVSQPGAPVMIMDLKRPPSKHHALELVEKHADGAPEQMARDFYYSLLAAFTPDEVNSQLNEAVLPGLHLEVVSDRHMLIHGRA